MHSVDAEDTRVVYLARHMEQAEREETCGKVEQPVNPALWRFVRGVIYHKGVTRTRRRPGGTICVNRML